MATLIDCSAGVPAAVKVRAAGHVGAVRYVADPRASWMKGKPLTRHEADDYARQGLQLVSNFQHLKDDSKRGYAGGVADAKRAREIHIEAGGPDSAPIFFSVDWDVTLSEWNDVVAHYFRGVGEVLGRERVGIYGHSRAIAWAIEDGLLGKSSTPGKYWGWQCRAWSAGVISKEAVMYQRVIDTPTQPGPKVDGITVDVSDILAADYGQWTAGQQTAPAPIPKEPSVNKPHYEEVINFGPNTSNRHGAKVINFYLHTEEGNGTAASLANYCRTPSAGVSYHYTVRDRKVHCPVPTSRAAWAVLNANPSSINLCFAGSRASWNRDQWLAIEGDLEVAAYLAIQDCREYGFPANVLAPPYKRGQGISDHNYVTRVLGMGTHWDVGPSFPWDVFARYVEGFLHGKPVPVVPVVNAIDEAAGAAAWLGKRLHDGEHTTPDTIGRFARFENGYIYWTSETGAIAVPTAIQEVFAKHEWEQGLLGYPLTGHTVLKDKDGKNWGDVQGFQGGAVYRKYGQPGYVMTGMIRAFWSRSGYENGTFGWPTSEEVLGQGYVVQEFERGRITWSPTGAVGSHMLGDEWDGIASDPQVAL